MPSRNDRDVLLRPRARDRTPARERHSWTLGRAAFARVPRSRAIAPRARLDPSSVDQHAQAKEFTKERVLQTCLDAVAAGDEAALEACLLEVDVETASTETSAEVVNTLKNMSEVKNDAFWVKKLKELSAERVFEDCMTAVMRGDLDEVEACIVDAENDTLLK